MYTNTDNWKANMSIWKIALKSVQYAGSRISPCPAPTQVPCNGMFSRRILIAAMFSFEVDTLRISIAQYRGIADMLIVESTQTHNIHDIGTKPLLWNASLHRDFSNTSFVSSVVECVAIGTKPHSSSHIVKLDVLC